MAPAPTRKDEARLCKGIRRAMVRVLEAAGESPAYVQQQMGHASISMTLDVYGSWLPVRAAGAVDRLAAATNPDRDTMVTFAGSEPRKTVSAQGA